MRIDILSIFPEMFESPLQASLLGKAIEAGVIDVRVHDLRAWATPPHFKVDDEPYGGGAGMVMMSRPIVEAVESLLEPQGVPILLAAGGKRFDDAWARNLADAGQLVLVCGRYEGVDDRARQLLGAQELSIGDYVLSGGEIGALVVIDAVARLLPGVMGNVRSLSEESFRSGVLEYPQFTRPPEYRGLEVPEVLRSGNHAEIVKWQRTQSLRRTFENRPDLLDTADLTTEEVQQVERWRMEG